VRGRFIWQVRTSASVQVCLALSIHFIRRLALRAKGARAIAPSTNGGSSTSAKSFFVHHTQQLAAAAQVGDAKGIRKKITEMKMRALSRTRLRRPGGAKR